MAHSADEAAEDDVVQRDECLTRGIHTNGNDISNSDLVDEGLAICAWIMYVQVNDDPGGVQYRKKRKTLVFAEQFDRPQGRVKAVHSGESSVPLQTTRNGSG